MLMASNKPQAEADPYAEAAASAMPKSTRRKAKRIAPTKRDAIRRDPEKQAKKYGRPTSFRASDEFRQALFLTAKKHGVSSADLIIYFTIQGMIALESGKLKLPVREGRRKGEYLVNLPPVPEILPEQGQ
jgi:hypothetical protein